MTDLDDNELFEGFDFENLLEPEESPPKPPRRKFGLLLGIVGVFSLLVLIAMAVIAAIYLPARSADRLEKAARIYAANTATAMAATRASQVQPLLLTPAPAAGAAFTPQPSPTSVVIRLQSTPESPLATAETGAELPADLAARTLTVLALQTPSSQ